MYRKSSWVHVFFDQNIVWHSLNKTWLKLNQQILRLISDFSADLNQLSSEYPTQYKRLRLQGYITTKEEDLILLQKAVSKISPKQIQAMYLILTTDCNMSCTYCLYANKFSESLNKKRLPMSIKTAVKAIDLFASITEKNDRGGGNYWEQITFYGGEPLLNFDCLEKSVLYLKKLQAKGRIWPNMNLVVNTNGLLINDQIAVFAAKNNLEIQISIDGLFAEHDAQRLSSDNLGTFKRVEKALKILHNFEVNFTPLITLTSQNTENLPDLLQWLYLNFQIKQYGVNLLMHTKGDINNEYPVKAAQAMIKANQIAKKLGINDDGFESTWQSFSESSLSLQSCGAGKKITIFPEGEIHTCQALEQSGITFLSHLPNFSTSTDCWQTWSQRSRFNNSTCFDCPILGACGGGCASSAYHAYGDINAIDPNYCGWIKYLFSEWLKTVEDPKV